MRSIRGVRVACVVAGARHPCRQIRRRALGPSVPALCGTGADAMHLTSMAHELLVGMDVRSAAPAAVALHQVCKPAAVIHAGAATEDSGRGTPQAGVHAVVVGLKRWKQSCRLQRDACHSSDAVEAGLGHESASDAQHMAIWAGCQCWWPTALGLTPCTLKEWLRNELSSWAKSRADGAACRTNPHMAHGLTHCADVCRDRVLLLAISLFCSLAMHLSRDLLLAIFLSLSIYRSVALSLYSSFSISLPRSLYLSLSAHHSRSSYLYFLCSYI